MDSVFYDGASFRICTVCARSGSKGVANKNIRSLAGKPLIQHAIDVAKRSRLFDAVVVSSDSEEYLRIAEQAGADQLVLRPASLASDDVTKLGAIAHCVGIIEEEFQRRATTLVDLDVTAPLRLPEDVQGAVDLLESVGCSSVITGTQSRRSPYYNLVELDEYGVARVSKPAPDVQRRQQSPMCFDMNAAVYVWRRDTFITDPKVFYDDTRLYVMPEERGFDIDSEFDFQIVEMLMATKMASGEGK